MSHNWSRLSPRILLLDFGDGCWRSNIIMSCFRCWWHFRCFAIFSSTSLTINENLLSKFTVHKLHFQSDDIIIIRTTHCWYCHVANSLIRSGFWFFWCDLVTFLEWNRVETFFYWGTDLVILSYMVLLLIKLKRGHPKSYEVKFGKRNVIWNILWNGPL